MTTTLRQFIVSNGLSMTATWAQDNPTMAHPIPGASHWRCTLKCGKRRMTVPFSMGPAHSGEPELESVLDCLWNYILDSPDDLTYNSPIGWQ